MNFSELKAEFADRGNDHLTPTRQGRYINWARAELDDSDLWPYRESSLVGESPLIVSDLGTIELVMDVNAQPLKLADYRDLVSTYGDLSITGTAQFYYVGTPEDTPEVAVYPVSEDVIGVQYWCVTPDLVDDSDVPQSPARFHKLIVDIAVREAYRDNDNHEAAEQLQVQIDRDLSRMREALLIQSTQGPQASVQITERW